MEKSLVIDGTKHVAGKLAAFVADRLLNGYTITVVCTENLCLTGPLHRHEGKYKSFKEKRAPYNPDRGSFHWSEPSMYFKHKILRGMLAYKTTRGAAALANLTCYESIPASLENAQFHVVPGALLEAVTDCNRTHCTLGQLLSKFGWHYAKQAEEQTARVKAELNEMQAQEEERAAKRRELAESADFKAEVDRRLRNLAH